VHRARGREEEAANDESEGFHDDPPLVSRNACRRVVFDTARSISVRRVQACGEVRPVTIVLRLPRGTTCHD
jgi:hypothetical protein